MENGGIIFHCILIKGGRQGRNWEVVVDTYTSFILCIKYITNENILYSSGNAI